MFFFPRHLLYDKQPKYPFFNNYIQQKVPVENGREREKIPANYRESSEEKRKKENKKREKGMGKKVILPKK